MLASTLSLGCTVWAESALRSRIRRASKGNEALPVPQFISRSDKGGPTAWEASDESSHVDVFAHQRATARLHDGVVRIAVTERVPSR